MSFTDSPVVRTDDLDRGLERGLVALSLPLAAVLPWLESAADLDVSWKSATAISLVLLIAYAWRTIGWLGGPRSIRQATWFADGTWQLLFRDGSCETACLDRATRLLPPIASLVWRSPRGRSYMLVRARADDATFRRLASRLGFAHGPSRATTGGERSVT